MKEQEEFRKEEKRNYVVAKFDEEFDILVLKNLFSEGKKYKLEGLTEALETLGWHAPGCGFPKVCAPQCWRPVSSALGEQINERRKLWKLYSDSY